MSEQTELRRIVDADRPHATPPDLSSLRAAGRRRLLRHRAGVGLGALAVVGVLAVPAYVVARDGSDSTRAVEPAATTSPTKAPETGTWTPSRGCGIFACDIYDPVREPDQILGDVWELPTDLDGDREIVYASKGPGTDMETGEPAQTTSINIGVLRGGEPWRMAAPLRPGDEGGPTGDPRGPRTASVKERTGSFRILGYVPGTHTDLTWTDDAGTTRPVEGLNADVVPGFTVFYVTGWQNYTPGANDWFAIGLTIDVPGLGSYPIEPTQVAAGGW